MNDRSCHWRESFLLEISLGLVAKHSRLENPAVYFTMETGGWAATTEPGSEVRVPETPGHTWCSANDVVHGKASRVSFLSHSWNCSPNAESKGTWSWPGKSRTSELRESCYESLSVITTRDSWGGKENRQSWNRSLSISSELTQQENWVRFLSMWWTHQGPLHNQRPWGGPLLFLQSWSG